MATDRMAKVTWTGSLMDGSRHDRGRRQRCVRAARRHLGVAGGDAGRPHQSRGADRRRVGVVFLDGPVARPRGRGAPPERLETSVTVTFQPGEGIVKGAIEVVGTVSGVDHDGFVEHAEGAVVNCPVSKALTGIPEVTLDATLATA